MALPILLPIIRRMTVKRVAFLGCFLVFVMLFVFPFSQTWREANWYQRGGPQKNADIGEVASSVIASWEHFGLLETAQISTAKWLSRSFDLGGWRVGHATRRPGWFDRPRSYRGIGDDLHSSFSLAGKADLCARGLVYLVLGYGVKPGNCYIFNSNLATNRTLLDVRCVWRADRHDGAGHPLFSCVAVHDQRIRERHCASCRAVCPARAHKRFGGDAYHLCNFGADHSCGLCSVFWIDCNDWCHGLVVA